MKGAKVIALWLVKNANGLWDSKNISAGAVNFLRSISHAAFSINASSSSGVSSSFQKSDMATPKSTHRFNDLRPVVFVNL